MSLFSKLFGTPKPDSLSPSVTESAPASEVIGLAIRSVIQESGGNCATIQLVTNSDYWIQIMDHTINCHYPHKDSPEWLFPELCKQAVIAGIEDYQSDVSMTVTLNKMTESEISKWIERYLTEVLSVDLSAAKLKLTMETL